MHTIITSERLLSDQQARAVRAALNLLGTDQKRFARSASVSYSRLNRVIAQKEVPSDSYANLLNGLLKRGFKGYRQAA